MRREPRPRGVLDRGPTVMGLASARLVRSPPTATNGQGQGRLLVLLPGGLLRRPLGSHTTPGACLPRLREADAQSAARGRARPGWRGRAGAGPAGKRGHAVPRAGLPLRGAPATLPKYSGSRSQARGTQRVLTSPRPLGAQEAAFEEGLRLQPEHKALAESLQMARQALSAAGPSPAASPPPSSPASPPKAQLPAAIAQGISLIKEARACARVFSCVAAGTVLLRLPPPTVARFPAPSEGVGRQSTQNAAVAAVCRAGHGRRSEREVPPSHCRDTATGALRCAAALRGRRCAAL